MLVTPPIRLSEELGSRRNDRHIHKIMSSITYLTACGLGAESFSRGRCNPVELLIFCRVRCDPGKSLIFASCVASMDIWATPRSNSVPYLSQSCSMATMAVQMSNLTMNMASGPPGFIPLGSPAFISLAAALLILLVAYGALSPSRKLPPGPKGLPVLGNLFQLDNRPWLRFTQWKEKYGRSNPTMSRHTVSILTEIHPGALLHLHVFGRSIIVINNLKTAADLMDRRAIITADRPGTIVANMMTGGLLIPFISHNDT